jgi:hypothetical protein
VTASDVVSEVADGGGVRSQSEDCDLILKLGKLPSGVDGEGERSRSNSGREDKENSKGGH